MLSALLEVPDQVREDRLIWLEVPDQVRDDRLIWFEVLDQVRDDKIKMPSGAIPVAAVTKFAGAVEDFKLRFPRSYANTRE